MFGYSKESFSCVINRFEDNIAHIELTDSNGDKSFMEIPKEDLEKFNITFKQGNIFKFILKQFLGWEKTIFKPIVIKSLTEKEIETTIKYYEERYGDV